MTRGNPEGTCSATGFGVMKRSRDHCNEMVSRPVRPRDHCNDLVSRPVDVHIHYTMTPQIGLTLVFWPSWLAWSLIQFEEPPQKLYRSFAEALEKLYRSSRKLYRHFTLYFYYSVILCIIRHSKR